MLGGKQRGSFLLFGSRRREMPVLVAAILLATCVNGGGLQIWAAGNGDEAEETDILFSAPSREGKAPSREGKAPSREGEMSFREALSSRRSVRSFAAKSIARSDAGRLLWAGGGVLPDAISGPSRTAPSAGAIYPINLFFVAGDVEGIASGVYRYLPEVHGLQLRKEGDLRERLAAAALSQMWIADAPAAVVIAGDPEAVARKYGSRGAERYLQLDAGAAAENILLEAVAAGLGAAPVGAFRDPQVQKLLGTEEMKPLLIIPVGVPR